MNRETPASGFTLIELLVLIAIIGILVSVAALSMGTNGYQHLVEKESSRLVAVMQMMCDDAILQGIQHGLLSEPDRYQVISMRHKEWLYNPDDRLYAPHVLPKSILIEWRSHIPDSMPLPQMDQGQMVFLALSSGESTPFEAQVRHRDQNQTSGMTIQGNGLCGISKEKPDRTR